jgi:hypothetical protein
LNAAGFAVLIGRSLDWMKKAESGKIPVPRTVLEAAAMQTGVDLGWLVTGDATAPPVDRAGRPYTLKTFHAHRGRLKSRRMEALHALNVCAWLPELAAIAESAANKFELAIFNSDLQRAVDRLRARYGSAEVNGGLADTARRRKTFDWRVREDGFDRLKHKAATVADGDFVKLATRIRSDIPTSP